MTAVVRTDPWRLMDERSLRIARDLCESGPLRPDRRARVSARPRIRELGPDPVRSIRQWTSVRLCQVAIYTIAGQGHDLGRRAGIEQTTPHSWRKNVVAYVTESMTVTPEGVSAEALSE